MLQTIRKALPLPLVPAQGLLCGASVLAFAWLLATDTIRPIAIYLLQLYLAF